jgi:hypothetical protein
MEKDTDQADPNAKMFPAPTVKSEGLQPIDLGDWFQSRNSCDDLGKEAHRPRDHESLVPSFLNDPQLSNCSYRRSVILSVSRRHINAGRRRPHSLRSKHSTSIEIVISKKLKAVEGRFA